VARSAPVFAVARACERDAGREGAVPWVYKCRAATVTKIEGMPGLYARAVVKQ